MMAGFRIPGSLLGDKVTGDLLIHKVPYLTLLIPTAELFGVYDTIRQFIKGYCCSYGVMGHGVGGVTATNGLGTEFSEVYPGTPKPWEPYSLLIPLRIRYMHIRCT